MLCIIPVLSNVLRFISWPMVWSLLENIRSLLTLRSIHCVKKKKLSDFFSLIVFQIVVIMRGLPGSGKTHVAKLIRVSMEK